MKRAVLLGLLGSTLLGCAAEPHIRHNHTYLLEWIGERPLIDNSYLTITMGKDGRAYGSGGCNHWFAPYTQEDHTITIGPVGNTRKVCAPAVMEQEQRFLDALNKVQRWDISPIGQLRLWPEQGKPLRLWLEDS
jgi:heat shock protein HslJ